MFVLVFAIPALDLRLAIENHEPHQVSGVADFLLRFDFSGLQIEDEDLLLVLEEHGLLETDQIQEVVFFVEDLDGVYVVVRVVRQSSFVQDFSLVGVVVDDQQLGADLADEEVLFSDDQRVHRLDAIHFRKYRLAAEEVRSFRERLLVESDGSLVCFFCRDEEFLAVRAQRKAVADGDWL